jgi:hypothetical protein
MQTIHKLEKHQNNFIDASGRFGWSKIWIGFFDWICG